MGGQFLDFMGGGHSCYEGGHRAHGDLHRKTKVMLHIGAGHGNNCQIILKLFRYACIYGCRILSFRTWREITQICNFAHVKKLSFRAWREITQICNFAHFENKQNMYTE